MTLKDSHTVLELEANNHPGVMSHICGLFSRRAYNMEGLIAMPLEGTGRSRIWLLVNEETRLEQVVSQLMNLQDVINIREHNADHEVFTHLESFFQS